MENSLSMEHISLHGEKTGNGSIPCRILAGRRRVKAGPRSSHRAAMHAILWVITIHQVLQCKTADSRQLEIPPREQT
jgi:hypothetical protein